MNCKVLAASFALILSTAGLVTVAQPRAAGAGAEIKAVGTLTTTILGSEIAQRSQGNLVVLSRYALSTYGGSLQGKTLTLQTVVRDDPVGFQTNTGHFWGTLEGSKPGSFSFIVHNVVDRTDCPCPPGLAPFEAKFVVVEGTGSGALEGICGGGTLKTDGTPFAATEYNYTFRFGKDCKAND